MPRRTSLVSFASAATIAALAFAATSFASGGQVSEVRFSGGRFEPAQVVVPANAPFQVRVTNTDKSVIEFESFELRRERVVRPGESITVYVAPLAPGTYKFFDDFDHSVSEGEIVAK
jgi:Cupredoxin-like domain